MMESLDAVLVFRIRDAVFEIGDTVGSYSKCAKFDSIQKDARDVG